MLKCSLIVLLCLFLSCAEKQIDSSITIFGEILGERQTKALNLLVTDFEDSLIKNYPDLSIEEAYRKYLKELNSDATTDGSKFNFQSNETNYEFHQSGLYDEIYTYNYQYISGSKDSIKVLKVNPIGDYMRALYAVKDSDSLVEEYQSLREATGMMQNELFANGILSLNPDFTNYFHKRIVVLEHSF